MRPPAEIVQTENQLDPSVTQNKPVSDDDNTPPPKKSSTGFYFPYLDSIRGIAIIMVVLFHALSFYPKTFRQEIYVKFIDTLAQGVPIFFVLSGFLISLIVFHEPQRFSWRNYILRRFAKIFPPFFLSAVLWGLVKGYHGDLKETCVLLLANLATIPNFLQAFDYLNPVTWSLFVEVHFYVVLPIVYFSWRRFFQKRAEVLTVATFLAVATVCRLYSWTFPAKDLGERHFLLSRFPNTLDYFAWGMIFAIIFQLYAERLRRTQTPSRMAWCGLFLLGCYLLANTALVNFGIQGFHQDNLLIRELNRILICVTSFLLLFTTLFRQEMPAPLVFGSKPLIYIGQASYEWFLFHLFLILRMRFWICKLLNLPTELQSANGTIESHRMISLTSITVICIILSFLVSAVIFEKVSKPLMKALRN